MIERYSLSAPATTLSQRFAADVPEFYKPRYNAGPTQLLPAITNTSPQGLSVFYWGRPPKAAGNKPLSERIINVKLENLLDRPMLQKALFKTRCIIPADGFYAWKKIGKKSIVPHRFVTDQPLFSMAGFWEEFEDEDGSMLHTFALITTTANELVATVTDRMPVILTPESEKIWLSREADEIVLLSQLVTYPAAAMNHYTVSPRILDSRIDVPSLLTPTPPADQHGNLTLFD
ncbi:MAG: SOS response-associated peptidase [Cyclobacteriaceae bacterium]|nr:SOS response-associated peptidase [Cyclobacteriaceae bacterium]